MSDIRLRVTPRVLKSQSEEISSQIEGLKKNWQRIYDVVNGSNSYWQGEAGEKIRSYLKKNKEDLDRLFMRLEEHPKDLLQMAGIYQDVEVKAEEKANALPEQVIS